MFSDISVVISNNEKIMDFKKLWVVKLRTTQKTHNEWNSPNCYEIYRWRGEREKCESFSLSYVCVSITNGPYL
jgi:hypothetical protein